MNIGIFGISEHINVINCIKEIGAFLSNRGVEVFVCKDLYNHTNYKEILLYEELDFLITVGGDGTILSAIRYMQQKKVPIMGINLGKLGFLANVNKEETQLRLSQLLKNDFIKVERSLLSVFTCNNMGKEFGCALNEVTVSRKDTTSMITVETHLNGKYLSSYWADGLIICTPTGFYRIFFELWRTHCYASG